jgi:hypothetical protein
MSSKTLEENLRKVFSPIAAMAELEYLEYVERNGQKVCPFEKQALANIAQDGDWNQT